MALVCLSGPGCLFCGLLSHAFGLEGPTGTGACGPGAGGVGQVVGPPLGNAERCVCTLDLSWRLLLLLLLLLQPLFLLLVLLLVLLPFSAQT